MRRFNADERYEIQGIDLRIREGSKFPGDLVMEQWNGRRWCPVKMSHVFLMADFIAENEAARQNFVSFWKENGDTYFVRHIVEAIRNGWKPVADRLEQQRDRRAS